MDRQAFWAMYLGEHRHPANRALHAIGSLGALALVVLAVVLWAWWPLVAALVVGYGLAWTGHFLVERNRPATFRYPLRSFLADWRMLGLVLTGRAGRTVGRLGADGPREGDAAHRETPASGHDRQASERDASAASD